MYYHAQHFNKEIYKPEILLLKQVELRVMIEIFIRKTESIPKSLFQMVLLLLPMVLQNASNREVVTSINDANFHYFRL